MQHFRPRTLDVRSLSFYRAASARPGRSRARGRAVHLAAFTALTWTTVAPRNASAQTWAAPVGGSWSVAGNWLGGSAPLSDPATHLRFNASAADSYTALNDFVATPFVLNALDLDNSGTGAITVDGAPLSLDGGAPSIGLLGSGSSLVRNAVQLSVDTSVAGAGSGTITLQGSITSNPASARSLIADAPNGNVVLSGGAALYGLKVNRGNAHLVGGTYTLVSPQHGTDPFGNVSDGGFWSVVSGDTAGQVGALNVTGGAVLNAPNAFVANAPGSAGVATFNGPGTTANLPTAGSEGRLGVNFGAGTINVLAGATVNARRVDLGRQDSSTGYLLIDGVNSRINAAQSFNVPAGSNATGTALISNGGQLAITGGFAFIAGAANAANNSLPSTASVTVTGANSVLNVGSVGGSNNGQLSIGIGSTSVAAAGTLSLLAGGRAAALNTFIGRGQGVGSVVIDGAASRLDNGNQIAVSSAGSTPSQLAVTNGGTLSSGNSLFAGIGTFDTGIVTVSGLGSRATIAGATVLGGGNGAGAFGGNATLNIAGGAELRTDLLAAAENPNGRANLLISGAASKLTITDQLILGDDSFSNATMTVSNGATASVASAAFLSPASGAQSNLTITGAASSFASSGTLVELHVGGAFGVGGGPATFNVLDAATANASRIALVYTRGTINVGSGTVPASFTAGSGGLIVDGTVNYNSGTLSTPGPLAVGGSVLLSSAGAGRANKKTLDVGSVSLTASGIVDLSDNDMISRGSSKAVVQGYINASRHNGAWDLPGITSSAARDNPAQNTTLAVLAGAEYASMNSGTTQFNGRSFSGTDTLVKYTYYGDTDFNGQVNFDDYVRIDNGFNNHLNGWMNGDFDGNGQVNFDDYVLIDLAFNTQGTTLTRTMSGPQSSGPSLATERALVQAIEGQSVMREKRIAHAQPFGGDFREAVGLGVGTRAIPEPGSLGLSGGLLVGTCVPRRRRRCSGGRLLKARRARAGSAGVLS